MGPPRMSGMSGNANARLGAGRDDWILDFGHVRCDTSSVLFSVFWLSENKKVARWASPRETRRRQEDSMDFTLTPETEQIRQRTRAFVDEHVIPLESDPAN